MEKMCLFFCWSDSREPYNTNVAYISSQKSINVLLWSFFCFILFYLVRKVILIFCNIFLKLLFIVFLSKYHYFSFYWYFKFLMARSYVYEFIDGYFPLH